MTLRIQTCPEQGGSLVTSDSLVDSVQQVVEHCKVSHYSRGYTGTWHGRAFNGWDEIAKAFLAPWKEGLAKVSQMVEDIRKANIKEPEDVKRKGEWSEFDGDVDVDRYLGGSPEFMRHVRRRKISAPLNIAILCNVGNIADYTADQIFWRGAAAIAAIDLLEGAGYQCEVHVWNHALGCFNSSYTGRYKRRLGMPTSIKSANEGVSATGGSSFFFTAKVKECGDPLDMDRLANGMSAWFFRTIIFGMREVVRRGSYGAGSSYHMLGKWIDKMDITEGIAKVDIPSVYNRTDAIQAAKDILEKVLSGEYDPNKESK